MEIARRAKRNKKKDMMLRKMKIKEDEKMFKKMKYCRSNKLPCSIIGVTVFS